MGIGCLLLLQFDVSAFIYKLDQEWICCVIIGSCNSKQKNERKKTAGKAKAVWFSRLWHCGLMCQRYRSICEVFTVFGSCLSLIPSCTSTALVVGVKVALALQGFAPSVSEWTCELAPGRWPAAARLYRAKNKNCAIGSPEPRGSEGEVIY